MPELTKMGYDMIIDRIVNRQLKELPEGLTVQELNQWLTGYATCQNHILDIIIMLRDDFAR